MGRPAAVKLLRLAAIIPKPPRWAPGRLALGAASVAAGLHLLAVDGDHLLGDVRGDFLVVIE